MAILRSRKSVPNRSSRPSLPPPPLETQNSAAAVLLPESSPAAQQPSPCPPSSSHSSSSLSHSVSLPLPSESDTPSVYGSTDSISVSGALRRRSLRLASTSSSKSTSESTGRKKREMSLVAEEEEVEEDDGSKTNGTVVMGDSDVIEKKARVRRVRFFEPEVSPVRKGKEEAKEKEKEKEEGIIGMGGGGSGVLFQVADLGPTSGIESGITRIEKDGGRDDLMMEEAMAKAETRTKAKAKARSSSGSNNNPGQVQSQGNKLKTINVTPLHKEDSLSQGQAQGQGMMMEPPASPTIISARYVNGNATTDVDVKGTRTTSSRFTKQEKGKAIMLPAANDAHNPDQSKQPIPQVIQPHNGNTLAASLQQCPEPPQEETDSKTRLHRERFRQIARKNASRFAQFELEPEGDDGDDDHSSESEPEDNNVHTPSSQANQDVEDWPGPFSTALKIIQDRAMNLNVQHQSSSDKPKSIPITWYPRNNSLPQSLEPLVPSLRELSIKLLSANAEAIVSLENIPDDLRNRLTQLLCDSRRMNSHFLALLFHGSPTEVCVRDCSSITEEQFTTSFEGCDTNNLRVLQLDQCGRCMPDYILQSTLARSFNNLPALTTISLTGACRLSDIGLSALVRAAPTLRSINLSQCSLLTSASLYTLADMLGSVLRELYIDNCQNIDAMRILRALEKLEHLEVLSIAGSQTVCDRFIKKLIAAHGQNLKALTLSDCVKLTDVSLKAISQTCSRLFALDLVNLCKLTDSALAHLANGCPAINTLKLRNNAFSDEAIAAFLETCGDTFIELSLNNVRKVGPNTAISLAKHSQKLETLDLSWCRNLTDEAMGLIVDRCSSLRVLKLFGCTQITDVFLDGHSNRQVKIIGMKMSPL